MHPLLSAFGFSHGFFFFSPYRLLSVLTYSSRAIPFSYAYFTLLTTTGQSLFSLPRLSGSRTPSFVLSGKHTSLLQTTLPHFLHAVVARIGLCSLYCLIADVMSYDATCTHDHEKNLAHYRLLLRVARHGSVKKSTVADGILSDADRLDRTGGTYIQYFVFCSFETNRSVQ